jgi:hypothetical protein
MSLLGIQRSRGEESVVGCVSARILVNFDLCWNMMLHLRYPALHKLTALTGPKANG